MYINEMWNSGSLMYLNRLANELDSVVGSGLENSPLFGELLMLLSVMD